MSALAQSKQCWLQKQQWLNRTTGNHSYMQKRTFYSRSVTLKRSVTSILISFSSALLNTSPSMMSAICLTSPLVSCLNTMISSSLKSKQQHLSHTKSMTRMQTAGKCTAHVQVLLQLSSLGAWRKPMPTSYMPALYSNSCTVKYTPPSIHSYKLTQPRHRCLSLAAHAYNAEKISTQCPGLTISIHATLVDSYSVHTACTLQQVTCSGTQV